MCWLHRVLLLYMNVEILTKTFPPFLRREGGLALFTTHRIVGLNLHLDLFFVMVVLSEWTGGGHMNSMASQTARD